MKTGGVAASQASRLPPQWHGQGCADSPAKSSGLDGRVLAVANSRLSMPDRGLAPGPHGVGY